MNRMIKRIIAVWLVFVMALVVPLVNVQPVAAAEEEKSEKDSGTKYISEVRIGMGETEAEAKKELEADGFTILKDESGNLADLNVDAGSQSALKRGANDKIVYLGYKMTDNAYDAITDLAVMNMNGGYSIEDYNILMDKQMNSQIKPFVESFIATLEEYRTNYKKSKKSLNYIRANHMRKMMNLLTDDDTDGQPMGDLLLNKTKFELGDKAYDALSDEEKKNHCDILTLLMQANGKATLSLESLLTKAADTSKDTWVDRMAKTSLDDLMEQIESENPNLSSRKDVLSELDKRYYDTAKKLLGKWNGFQSELVKAEDKAEELTDAVEENAERLEEIEDVDLLEASEEEFDEFVEATKESGEQIQNAQIVTCSAYLKSVKYEDGTLLDFFSQKEKEVSGDTGIRKLYPIVDALSAGQIAGLEFVSLEDLVTLAMSDEKSYQNMVKNAEGEETVSVYENVDRGIYEKGGVALTDDALRAKASSVDTSSNTYALGTLPKVLWCATAGSVIASIASAVVRHAQVQAELSFTKLGDEAYEMFKSIWNNSKAIESKIKWLGNTANQLRNGDVVHGIGYVYKVNGKTVTESLGLGSVEAQKEVLNNRLTELDTNQYYVDSLGTGNVAKYVSYGFAVVTVLLTIASTVMTMLDAAAFYDTEYVPIPKYMVERADITTLNEKGEEVMVKNQTAYYKVVTCNRTEGDNKTTKKNYEAMGDSNDLNGDIGTQWLALYAVKYENGAPILADSLLYQKENSTVPSGYSTGIHEFGGKAATNLNNKNYLFRDEPPSIKVFFKTEKKTVKEITATGSIFGVGSVAMGGGVGLVVGAILGALVMGRRKKKITE